MTAPLKRVLFKEQATFTTSRDNFLKIAKRAVQQLQHPHGIWTLDGYNSDALFLRMITDSVLLETYPYLPQHIDQQFGLAFTDQNVTLSLETYSSDAAVAFRTLVTALNTEVRGTDAYGA